MTVTALLGEQASAELVKGVLEIARELAKDEIQRLNAKPLRQQEVMKLYKSIKMTKTLKKELKEYIKDKPLHHYYYF